MGEEEEGGRGERRVGEEEGGGGGGCCSVCGFLILLCSQLCGCRQCHGLHSYDQVRWSPLLQQCHQVRSSSKLLYMIPRLRDLPACERSEGATRGLRVSTPGRSR